MYAVAVGEMFDAVNFFGPFDEFEDAAAWAYSRSGYSWWVVELISPEED